jgi:hypothetical protein
MTHRFETNVVAAMTLLILATRSSPTRAEPPQGPVASFPPPYVLPPTLPYQPGAPIPPRYRLEEHENRPLAVTGASILGSGYFLSVVNAIAVDNIDAPNALLIPLVGPFVSAAQAKRDQHAVFPYVFLGGLQAAGVSLMVMSELFPTRRLVVVPTVGEGRGLQIAGSF